jgi:succinate dehydrogenase / fumarate reductase, membrane anchor subunit
MSYKYSGSGSSGAMSWFLQRISGVILVAVMIGHFILMHYNIESGHTYEAVLARMQNPFYQMLQITFVILALYHGLQGVWNIIRDFRIPSWLSMTVLSVLILAGIGFGALGVATILHF